MTTTETATAKVEKMKKGEYVRKPGTKKIYECMGYCRLNRKYQLDDISDISRAIYVKKGTILEYGFDY